MEGQHNWIRFPLSLSSGTHSLTAESDTGATWSESFQVPGDVARYAVSTIGWRLAQQNSRSAFSVSLRSLANAYGEAASCSCLQPEQRGMCGRSPAAAGEWHRGRASAGCSSPQRCVRVLEEFEPLPHTGNLILSPVRPSMSRSHPQRDGATVSRDVLHFVALTAAWIDRGA